MQKEAIWSKKTSKFLPPKCSAVLRGSRRPPFAFGVELEGAENCHRTSKARRSRWKRERKKTSTTVRVTTAVPAVKQRRPASLLKAPIHAERKAADAQGSPPHREAARRRCRSERARRGAAAAAVRSTRTSTRRREAAAAVPSGKAGVQTKRYSHARRHPAAKLRATAAGPPPLHTPSRTTCTHPPSTPLARNGPRSRRSTPHRGRAPSLRIGAR